MTSVKTERDMGACTQRNNACEDSKVAMCKPTERPQEKPNIQHVNLGLPFSRTVRIQFLLFQTSSLCYFVMTALKIILTNKDPKSGYQSIKICI